MILADKSNYKPLALAIGLFFYTILTYYIFLTKIFEAFSLQKIAIHFII